MNNVIKQLKELRRQAGYEPSAWYEAEEEKLLTQALTQAEKIGMEKGNEK